jgi:hypothetical protein
MPVMAPGPPLGFVEPAHLPGSSGPDDRVDGVRGVIVTGLLGKHETVLEGAVS